MDEFGQRPVEVVPEPEEEIPQQSGPQIEDRRPIQPMQALPRSRMTTSPPPFAHYDPLSTTNTYVQPLDTHLDDKNVVEVAEEGGAGCCKCVIM